MNNAPAIPASTQPETVASLRRALEFAPRDPGPMALDLLGWWTPDGCFVCARCAGRIMARGCSIPRESKPCWRDQTPGTCCTCDEGAS